MSATGDGPAAGFTLIEMLVALAILALIGSIVFPKLERGVEAHTLRGAGFTAAATLRSARARAFATDMPVAVRVGGAGDTLLVEGVPANRLPAPLRAATVPADGISFFGDGSSTGGTLSIIGDGQGYRFVVSPVTGLATVAA